LVTALDNQSGFLWAKCAETGSSFQSHRRASFRREIWKTELYVQKSSDRHNDAYAS
jgi:hypothetical protein